MNYRIVSVSTTDSGLQQRSTWTASGDTKIPWSTILGIESIEEIVGEPSSGKRLPKQSSRQREGLAVAGQVGSAEYLTPAQVAVKFTLSISAVYAACRSGMLAHYRVPSVKGAGGKYLIKEVDVVAWFETLKVASQTTPSASVPISSGSPAALFSELNPKRLARAWKPD